MGTKISVFITWWWYVMRKHSVPSLSGSREQMLGDWLTMDNGLMTLQRIWISFSKKSWIWEEVHEFEKVQEFENIREFERVHEFEKKFNNMKKKLKFKNFKNLEKLHDLKKV